jgi:hypothetical protein
MKKHALFVAGLLGFLLVNSLVIRYCWAHRETGRPPAQHRKVIKPGTATAFSEDR